MVERVRRYMEQWNMAEPGDVLIVGLSGGADSVCLCLVLKELSERMGFSLAAVHVEHGIRREESVRDMEFVRALCERLGVPLAVSRVDVPGYAGERKLGIEEAARILRHEEFARAALAFEGTAGGGRRKIALAHHREDNAETVLMALVRGTGLDGLCGIAPVREDMVCYVRPLLNEGREDIEAFLRLHGQAYCEDSTNLDVAYRRNFLRREVFPMLAQVNPQAVVHMNRTVEQLLELRTYVEEVTASAYAQAVSSNADGELWLDVESLSALPKAIRMRVLHRALGEAAGGRKDIGAVHIEALAGLMHRQTGRQVNLPGGLVARREYGRICLGGAAASRADEPVAVTAEQLAVVCGGGKPLVIPLRNGRLELAAFAYRGKTEEISTKMYTKWFDYDMIKDGFVVRTRREGDYFMLDAAGKHKKLSNYFVDIKLPAGQRAQALLLAAGSQILWHIGGRMGCGAMVTERTKTVLQITYRGEEEHGLQQEA